MNNQNREAMDQIESTRELQKFRATPQLSMINNNIQTQYPSSNNLERYTARSSIIIGGPVKGRGIITTPMSKQSMVSSVKVNKFANNYVHHTGQATP